jgi:hypothetical protein
MIIAFGHRRRVGKDTATRLFVDALASKNIPARQVSFAGSLKDVCADIFGWAGLQGPSHYEEHPAEKEEILPALGLSPRRIWIDVGNKLREVYEDVWIDLALNQAAKEKTVIIISDLRYPNEVDKVHCAGGVVVKIVRDKAPISNDVADTALANYEKWDMTIENNGTIDEFRQHLLPLVHIVEMLYGFPSPEEQLEEG